jgi:hypothetical protein
MIVLVLAFVALGVTVGGWTLRERADRRRPRVYMVNTPMESGPASFRETWHIWLGIAFGCAVWLAVVWFLT